MSRSIPILSRLALCAALASASSIAHAQQGYQQGYGPQYGQPQYSQPQNYGPQNNRPQNNRQNGNGAGNNGGLLPLPKGVTRVVGIDAQNVLLVELEPEVEGGPSEYRAIPVRHVYVGGIAKLFGGTTISTEEFVSPAFSKGGGFGQNNNNTPGNFTGNNNSPTGFSSGPNNSYPNGGYPNNGYPNGGYVPNGYPNGVPLGAGFGGGFAGSPQITYGVGGITETRIVPNQSITTTTEQGR